MIKSPLRYPGGKSRAVELITSLIPEFEEYREPFLGGGSVFVYLKQIFNNKKYWLNDLYYDLYLFWEYSKNNYDDLIIQINKWRNEFNNGKELHFYLKDNRINFSELELAASFFILNRITFSGTSLSGGYSEYAFKGRFTESSIKRLDNFSKLLTNTKITNEEYEFLVNEDGDNVFLFLDPPYHSATKSALYGKNGNLHKSFDHIKFADIMKNCKHNYLITYDDSEYIRELFDFATIIPWNLKYGMRNVGKNSNQNGKEIFISNYLNPDITFSKSPAVLQESLF